MAGRIQIRTPTNQKLLTNVAVVRIKKTGKRFEIACYRNKVVSWRTKVEKDIDEVLQSHTVFTNVSKGQVAKREEILAAFGTDDQTEVCKMILEKGELQVSDKERSAAQESTVKEVATIIADMCINPTTKLPYPVSTIENALKDIHFSVKANRSAKQLALETIPNLSETMPIERAKMRVHIALPASIAKQAHDKVKEYFVEVEQETFDKGNLDMVGLVEPGSYRALDELVRKDAKGKGALELLELRHIAATTSTSDHPV